MISRVRAWPLSRARWRGSSAPGAPRIPVLGRSESHRGAAGVAQQAEQVGLNRRYRFAQTINVAW
jgi:hypothetical protein